MIPTKVLTVAVLAFALTAVAALSAPPRPAVEPAQIEDVAADCQLQTVKLAPGCDAWACLQGD